MPVFFLIHLEIPNKIPKKSKMLLTQINTISFQKKPEERDNQNLLFGDSEPLFLVEANISKDKNVAQIFTLLKADPRQDINGGFALIGGAWLQEENAKIVKSNLIKGNIFVHMYSKMQY